MPWAETAAKISCHSMERPSSTFSPHVTPTRAVPSSQLSLYLNNPRGFIGVRRGISTLDLLGFSPSFTHDLPFVDQK